MDTFNVPKSLFVSSAVFLHSLPRDLLTTKHKLDEAIRVGDIFAGKLHSSTQRSI